MNCGSLSLTSTTVMLTSVELDNDGRPLSYTVNVVICTKPMNVYSVLKKNNCKGQKHRHPIWYCIDDNSQQTSPLKLNYDLVAR